MKKIGKITINIILIILLIFVSTLFYNNSLGDFFAEYLGLNKTESSTEVTSTPSPSPSPEIETTEEVEQTPTPKPLIPRQEILDLRAEHDNDDIVGYLNIKGTSINYPILQSYDNEYYLERNMAKQYDLAGSLYLDYENNIEVEDLNHVIYGHNMKNDIMFHSIRYYSSKDYYDQHKYIQFDTLYEEGIWEVFSFMKTTTDFNYIQVIFQNDAYFYGMLKEMQNQSIYETGVEVSSSDRILTLSTCADASPTSKNRLVVCARKLSEDEITDEIRNLVYNVE